MTTPTPAQYYALLRTHFGMFAARAFRQINPGESYLPNWHIDAIGAKLNDVLTGKTRRLIINMPPRYMKSLLTTVAFPAYLLGHRPSEKIIAVSYSQDLANRHSADCRALMESPWYQRAFPTRLSAAKNSVTEFTTTQRGFRLATSTTGTLTGRGGDVLIIDDPLKPDEALSESQRKRVNQWYDNTLHSRQNNKNAAAIILVMHRLHEDDLAGHLLQGQERWDVLSIPAVADEDAEFEIDTPLGRRVYRRSAGGVLHPAFESEEQLAITRATIGEYNFAGQYQQAPAPLGGGLVKEAWFPRYRAGDLPERFDQIVCSWDTAVKATQLADFSACTVWGVKDKRAYLLHVYRKKVEYPELKRAVIELASEYRATAILIEDKASGQQLVQELQHMGVSTAKAIKPEGDKILRLNAQTAAMENGKVLLPERAHWLAEYLHELTTFPNGKHDDQVDATSQALKFVSVGKSTTGLLEYYRMQYEDDVRRGLRPEDPSVPPVPR